MTTVRQVKKLLAPLAARHDDLELVGFTLYLKPVRHLLRGVIIERTGEAGRFRVPWAIMSLCEPRHSLPLNWGANVYPNRLWLWSNPTLQDDLYQAIEEQALPALRAIATLDDFFTFASNRERFGLWPFDLFTLLRVGVECARGDLDSARAGCAELKSGLTRWSMPSMREEFDRVTGELCPLLAANDRAGMARLLHQWEAYTVDKLKIGHIYEPTPFPLELMPLDEGPMR
jgi:hypothetical protein